MKIGKQGLKAANVSCHQRLEDDSRCFLSLSQKTVTLFVVFVNVSHTNIKTNYPGIRPSRLSDFTALYVSMSVCMKVVSFQQKEVKVNDR